MIINNRGFWENNSTEGHGVDFGLMGGLVKFFSKVNAKTIIDIGCGEGSYTRYLQGGGFYVEGYDGNPYTPKITNGLCDVADFSVPQFFGLFDWTLSLEVAEHVPQKFEDIFINNLHIHNTKGMVLSWSIPSFGGDGHVNSRDNDYVISKITKLGYTLDDDETTKLRYSCAEYPNPCWWFGHTLFVFHKGN